MWYLVFIPIAVIAILYIKKRNPGSAAKGGKSLGQAKASQSQKIQATVVRKDICAPAQQTSQPTPYFKPGQNVSKGATIYGVLYFELENGKKKNFYVSIKDFQSVSEGLKGTLEFSGNHFIHFESEQSA